MDMGIIAMQRDQLSNPSAWYDWDGHTADSELVKSMGMPDAELLFNCPLPEEGLVFVLVVHNRHTAPCRVSFNGDHDFQIRRLAKSQPE